MTEGLRREDESTGNATPASDPSAIRDRGTVSTVMQLALVLQKLEQNILVKNRGHLDTGMLGTYFMMEHLREIGRNDLVCTMFSQTTHPGWGHMLAAGATTFWEQWNGHWSHIHSCFTSPDNWFYQGLAGIQPDPAAPGFKNVIIRPAIVGDVTWVKGYHESPYGRIVSDWKRDSEILSMNVVIPPNSTATIFVPTQDGTSVIESGTPAGEAEAVRFLRMEDNTAVYTLASGTYHFQSRMVPPASHAENITPAPQPSSHTAGTAVSGERMQQIFEEVKTPYKYGIVRRGAPNQEITDNLQIQRTESP